MPRARHEGVATLHLAARTAGFLEFIRQAVPDYRWLSDLDAIAENAYGAVRDDLVSGKMETLLSDQTVPVHLSPRRTAVIETFVAGHAPPGADTHTQPLPEEEEDYRAWESRTDRVIVPALEQLRSHDAFQEMVYDLARALVPLMRQEGFIERARTCIQALLTREHAPVLKGLASAVLDDAFEPAALDATRSRVAALSQAFFAESDLGFVGDFIAAFYGEALTSRRAKKARQGAQRIVDTMLGVATEQTAIQIACHAVGALMQMSEEEIVEIVAEGMRRLLDAALTLASEQHISRDVNVLTVQEAAGYLGLRPISFQSHISARAGTTAEVPVKLQKKGRGRGTYTISLEDLKTWENDHWKKIRRRTRRGVPGRSRRRDTQE